MFTLQHSSELAQRNQTCQLRSSVSVDHNHTWAPVCKIIFNLSASNRRRHVQSLCRIARIFRVHPRK
ncbi:hypothetical protein MPTK1_8g04200 [Marchantia polymorpha subsp. ruderalis]|uniref:Uncharacterized protein n=1 Tax=Marchantia polymorpha TaxID=3197 RepID=A0A2R6XJI3_MARPO|nr:hypothetical protein MARPO_0012s0209 [Marchantia polymorpha]BBN18643.1 hypothetical protein Mp_8g04200 [Marchantia polymorpha subsp. ruderalis]|eukprot:PTQ46290.1 hypothetical protein MARPO_0012s0209 [Marchantia polymorpha]